MEEAEVVQTKKQPAITISVQSWSTPIVGVVMLIIGLFGGYYGRPLLGKNTKPVPVLPTIVSAPTGGGNQEMMTYLVSQARHFTGDENAPVTLVEFGDFQ